MNQFFTCLEVTKPNKGLDKLSVDNGQFNAVHCSMSGTARGRHSCLTISFSSKVFFFFMYYVIPSELLSVCPSIFPSAVEHSCPLHNFDTGRDNFSKLGTNINHDQTMCRD